MNIKFKILRIHTADHLIVVCYYTDIITEAYCAGRTTFSIGLPVPMLSGQDLKEYILKYAPVGFFETHAALVGLPTDISELESLVDKEVTPADTRIPLSDIEIFTKTKTDAIAAINIACRLNIMDGFTSSVLGTPHHYPYKDEDQLTILKSMSVGVDQLIKCIDATGIKAMVLHTPAQLTQLNSEGTTFSNDCLNKAATLKEQISAVVLKKLPAALNKINSIKW